MDLNTLKEIPTILGRIVTIIPLLLFVTLFMGRRSIGEMPVFDFLIIITLGAVVGADIADPSIHHLPTIVSIIAIGILQRVVSKWIISNRKIGRMITFEPAIVIWKGQLLHDNLRRIRYPIDNILVMLREHQIFDLSEVDTAIIESNGKLTVQKKVEKQNVTKEDLQIHPSTPHLLSFPLIMEGKIDQAVLFSLGLDENWLRKNLQKQGISDEKEVFFASINEEKHLSVSLYHPSSLSPPPLRH